MTATDSPVAPAATVLVVEDDAGIAELERGRLEDAGYLARVAATAAEALDAVAGGGIDLVLLDYRLPGDIDGLEFYARVKAAGYDIPVILVTGFGNEATVIQALRVGVRDFVTKSLEYLDYLPEAVGRVLRQVGTERRLAESEARLAGVIESAQDAVVVVEDDRLISLFNPAAERMFGCPAGAALGRRLTDFIPDDPGTPAGADDPSMVVRLRLGSKGVRADGTEFPVEATVAPGRAAGRTFDTVVVRDVTERVRAEETLRRSEALLRRAEAMAHVAGWTFELADGVHNSSEEGARIYECEPGAKTSEELLLRVHPADRPRALDAMRGALAGTPFEIEYRLLFGERVKWVHVRGEPETDADGRIARVIGVTQDVTERKRLEEQFRQAQKMEAFGQLAGGVAHDFNNLLTVINGFSDLLVSSIAAADPNRPMLDAIRDAGDRAAALTGQLLTFSRRAVVEPKVLDPNAVVADAGKMLRRLIGEDVSMVTVLHPTVSRVRADPGQLGQVLLNLAVNARDAMPFGGRLSIETRDVDLPPGPPLPPDARPGRYVRIAVTDTGVGMTDEVRERIFEPFFTTKGPGRGTGLGLATAYGIVRRSGGAIEVESAVGIGTTFRVYLPAVGEALSGAAGARPDPAPSGSERVLLVEDQDDVRRFAFLALQGAGYDVQSAADGPDALAQLTALPPIDILVTDVVMPGMSGRELAEAVRARHPAVKVLYMSGYTDDAVVRHGVSEADVAFLQKPYTAHALARKVREVLDRS